jgi:lipoprotein signal peptidase
MEVRASSYFVLNQPYGTWFHAVVDMFYFPFNGSLPEWLPFWVEETFFNAFNIADMAISTGVVY